MKPHDSNTPDPTSQASAAKHDGDLTSQYFVFPPEGKTVDVATRIAVWKRVTRFHYETRFFGEQTPDIAPRMEGMRMPHGFMSFVSYHNAVVVRDEARIDALSLPMLQVTAHISGRIYGQWGGDEQVVHAGDVRILTPTVPFQFTAEHNVSLQLGMPLGMVGFDPDLHPNQLLLRHGEPVTDYLFNGLQQLRTAFLAGDDQGVRFIHKAMSESVSKLLLRERRMESPEQAEKYISLARIRAYILDNLANPDLGVEDVLKAFAISRAALYRRFVYQGGIAHYISQERLRMAMVLLSAPATEQAPLKVSEVAERCGFADPHQFSRTFKARFGLPPSGVRAAAEQGRDFSQTGTIAQRPDDLVSMWADILREFDSE